MQYIQLDIDPDKIPGFVLWQVSKLWQRYLSLSVKKFGIGSTELVVLGNVVRFDALGQQPTQRLLTEMTKIDRMTCSQTIRSLERKRLVKRLVAVNDNRTFYVIPTKRGVEVADKALGKVIEAHEEFFAPLQNQTEQFLEFLQRLLNENSEKGSTTGKTHE